MPAYGVYTDLNDLDWDALPEQFVAKSTAGWGNKQVHIVKNKRNWNPDVFKASIVEWLYPWNSYYYANMCITDEKVRPRILIEKMLGDGESDVVDYKFYCAYGEPQFALIVSGPDRKNTAQSVCGCEDPGRSCLCAAVACRKQPLYPKPEKLEELLGLCRKLAANIPWIRLDFYEDAGQLYVGGNDL